MTSLAPVFVEIAGGDIVRQGTAGDAFYVLLEGTVEVLKAGGGKTVELTELRPGAYFGEQALTGKRSGLRDAATLYREITREA